MKAGAPATGGSTSAEAIRHFESGGQSPGSFRHADHIRMAWHYLQEMPLGEALPRYGRGLLALATRAGRPDRYHETITWGLHVHHSGAHARRAQRRLRHVRRSGTRISSNGPVVRWVGTTGPRHWQAIGPVESS